MDNVLGTFRKGSCIGVGPVLEFIAAIMLALFRIGWMRHIYPEGS